MKAPSPNTESGITRLEVSVLVVVITVLSLLLFSVLSDAEAMANGARCSNNLKNVGLAFRIFAGDNMGAFPMAVSITNGGTREWTSDASHIWRHFQSLSVELTTPEVLCCPADRHKQRAGVFAMFASNPTNHGAVMFAGNQHLSYFLGLNASEEQPQTILAGDRNLTTNRVPITSGRLLLTPDQTLGFSAQIHNSAGTLLFGDGRTEPVTSQGLNEAWRNARASSGLSTNVWLVP